MASTLDKIKDKVEQVTHTGPYSDKHHGTTSGTTGVTGTTGTTDHTGTTHHTGTVGTGAGSTNAGPHSSNTANKLDPRVDSDLDGSRNAGLASTHNAGRTGMMGSSNTAGPHSTDIGNRLDPRVDSDLDGSRNLGAAGTTGTTGTTGSTGASNYNDPRSTNAGPHSTNIGNTMDPRVDSDLDGSRNMGATGYGTGSASTGLTGTSGPGPAPNTAGPHKSDLLNKLDPRVDSDMDGSRTTGGSTTY